VKVTGLAQKLGQLEAVNMDLQPKYWANLNLLGQPCNFYAMCARHVFRRSDASIIPVQLAAVSRHAPKPCTVPKGFTTQSCSRQYGSRRNDLPLTASRVKGKSLRRTFSDAAMLASFQQCSLTTP
jgi:hypothetical protein